MTVRTIPIGGTDWSDGEVLFAADLNDTFDSSSIIAWDLVLKENLLSGTKYLNGGKVGLVSGGSLWTNVSGSGSFKYVTATTTLTLDSSFPIRNNQATDFTNVYAVSDYEFMNNVSDLQAGSWTGETGFSGTSYVYIEDCTHAMHLNTSDYYQTTHKVTVMYSNYRKDAGGSCGSIIVTDGTNHVVVGPGSGGVGPSNKVVEIFFNGTDDSCYAAINGSDTLTKIDLSSLVGGNWYIGAFAGFKSEDAKSGNGIRIYKVLDNNLTASSTVQAQIATHPADGSAYNTAQNISLETNTALDDPAKYGKLNLVTTISGDEIVVFRNSGFILK